MSKYRFALAVIESLNKAILHRFGQLGLHTNSITTRAVKLRLRDSIVALARLNCLNETGSRLGAN